MKRVPIALSLAAIAGALGTLRADEPGAAYIFPAGGQRGTAIDFRVGGLCLHDGANFEMLGPGVDADAAIRPGETVWFEGPVIPLPASQALENYPKDYLGQVRLAADAPLGTRPWRLWTSQGATPALRFVVGELPEIVEQEIDGEPLPVRVALPLTINGRTFPREDVDEWEFEARAGQGVWAEVCAARIGSPVDSQLEVLDSAGRVLAENGDALGADSLVRFTAPADGVYRVRILDANFGGLQHYAYRLTISTGPRVDGIYPLGGRRGTATQFELRCSGFAQPSVEFALPADGPADWWTTLGTADAASNSFQVDLDDLEERLEAEPNDDAASAPRVSPATVCNGRIDRPGDVDLWAFAAAAGQALELDLRAARLGSPLDGVLVVLDAEGQELARADDLADGQPDCRLAFTAPADGTFVVRVEERFSTRGGPEFAYRLRIAPPVPDYRLTLLPDALSVPRGGEAKLTVAAERLGGFNEEIKLAIDGLPAGIAVEAAAIPAGQASVQLTLKADAAAPIRASRVVVRGTAAIAGVEVQRTAALAPLPGGWPLPGAAVDSALVAVALPTPFKVVGRYVVMHHPRGTTYSRRYSIERGSYEGPLVVRLADRQARHLQGVSGGTIVVPAGATEFEYPVQLPPWMEIGRTSRSTVMAVGEIVEPDGSRHQVSFTSQNQNEQIVALVDPAPLAVQLERASLSAQFEAPADVPVRVQRDPEVEGDVRLELIVPPHIDGVAAEPIVVPAGQDRATLTIRFTSGAGPFNAPLLVRAAAVWRGQPAVAEAKLTVVPAR
jgi:hypothetical protein